MTKKYMNRHEAAWIALQIILIEKSEWSTPELLERTQQIEVLYKIGFAGDVINAMEEPKTFHKIFHWFTARWMGDGNGTATCEVCGKIEIDTNWGRPSP